MRTRPRYLLAALIAVVALALAPLSFHVERRLDTAVHLKGSEAEYVAEQLATRFHSPFVDRVVLVIQGLPAADSDEGTQALTTIVSALKGPDVSAIVSRLDQPDPIFLGTGGGTFVLIGLAPENGTPELMVPKIREQMRKLEDQLRGRYPAVKLELTGELPLNYDLREASSHDIRRGESLVLPATLILLLLAFGSCVAALIPLAVGQLGIAMALGLVWILASRWHLSILVQNLATMLGLSLGIDYALLMVGRFREALCAGVDPSEASCVAARQAGHTLLVSASTVAIGFAALLTVPISEIRSIGVSGFVVAGTSVLLATTLLPAGLALLGKRIDAGAVAAKYKLRAQTAARSVDGWKRWGRVVTSHPWIALIVAGLPLLLLAAQAARLNTELPRGDWLPPSAESVRAFHSLERMGRGGIVDSLRVILELPDSISQTDKGWEAATRLSARLASDQRADRVLSLATLTEGRRDFIGELSSETRRSFLRGDGKATLLELLPASGVTPAEQIRWVRDLRRLPVAEVTGVAGAKISVGGIPGLNADYADAVGDRLPRVIVLVVTATFLALFAGFRSLFAALKAVALNLISVGAAFGALVLVFQEGHGCRLLGVPEGTAGVFPIVPILAFAIVFGLSMDYEVFLVARVLESRRSGLGENEAIAEALAKTAGLITSAAAIMIVVFTGFTLGDFLVIKMLGFTLAVAVLIDATLVRIVIGPALLTLAGDWNWWPWGLDGSEVGAQRERETIGKL
ncbi:MAG TPA: MMPL family transporter [Terriglobales bacterium]|nr:MMPL family transporter [Terriglobales bacterium]